MKWFIESKCAPPVSVTPDISEVLNAVLQGLASRKHSACFVAWSFGAGIATAVCGYFLWTKLIRGCIVPACSQWRSRSRQRDIHAEEGSPQEDLYDPNYVLPADANWANLVEEEEKNNPNFGQNVNIPPLYNIEEVNQISNSEQPS